MSYNVQSKYQIIEGPLQQLPHKCAGCGTYGTPDNNKFFDWNLEIEFFGKVMLCLSCFTEMANQIGFYSPTQFNKLDDMFKRVDQINMKLREENKELKSAVVSLSSVLGVDIPTSILSDLPTEENRSDSSIESIDEEQSGSPEQINESGSTSISDNDSLNEFLGNEFDI